MKLKRFAWPGALVICVLALLVCAAWLSGQHHFQPMPKSLTTPPDVDRSHIPLGPYTADFSGLIGGPVGKGIVSFYVVMRPNEVHLQRVGEVGKRLVGSAVNPLGISYSSAYRPQKPKSTTGPMVDGLILVPGSLDTAPTFVISKATDATGRALRITCYLGADERALIAKNRSFKGVDSGMCTATFWFASDLYASLGGIQPFMFSSMAQFLPHLYLAVSNRIQGEL